MAPVDQVVQNAAENLLGDERLRSNLTDSEAKIVLDWALAWLAARANAARDQVSAPRVTQSELARVRQAVGAMNVFAKKPGAPRLSEAVAALDATLQGGKAFTREEVFSLLTALTSAAWQMRAEKKQ